MSEDTATIICKTVENKNNSLELLKSLIKENLIKGYETGSDFNKISYYENKNKLEVVIEFLSFELNSFENLMLDLRKSGMTDSFFSIWLDTTNVTFYYKIFNDKLYEFSSIDELKDFEKQFKNISSENISYKSYVKGRTTLVNLSVHSKKHKKVLNLFNNVLNNKGDDSRVQFVDFWFKCLKKGTNLSKEKYVISSEGMGWRGNIEHIIDRLIFVSDQGAEIILGFDLSELNLFESMPSEQDLMDEIEDINSIMKQSYRPNKRESEAEIQSRRRAAEIEVRRTLACSLYRERVELLAYHFMDINGVRFVHIKFRPDELHADDSLSYDEEIRAALPENDQMYYCLDEKVSSDEDWIMDV